MIMPAWRIAIATIVGAGAATSLARAEAGAVRGTIEVTRPSDVPTSPVLVYVVGFTEPAPSAPTEVKQIGKRFIPELIAVTARGSVTFPNGDPFLHNVFSPTSERSFDLGSYKRGDTRARSFPKPGVIDIYCNLHPEMSATLVVLPNTRFTVADAAGAFEIKNIPVGTWSIFAYSRRATQPVSATVTIKGGGTAEATLKLDEVQRNFGHRNKFGEAYRPTATYPPAT